MEQLILKHYSDEHRLSLLIRHGDRDAIPDGSFGNEVLLNEKGKQNAKSFGESLSERKLNKIFTSPVGRCIQTAEFITKGYGSPVEIIETTALGAPGLHIADEKIAGEYYLQHGGLKMYGHFMQGVKIPGVPKIEGIRNSLTNFLSENTNDNGLTLFVSHDMLIAFYHFSINKKVYTKDNWINYMTGLTFINGRIYER
jgi:hypothetical protein